MFQDLEGIFFLNALHALSNWWKAFLHFLVFCLFGCVILSQSASSFQGHHKIRHFKSPAVIRAPIGSHHRLNISDNAAVLLSPSCYGTRSQCCAPSHRQATETVLWALTHSTLEAPWFSFCLEWADQNWILDENILQHLVRLRWSSELPEMDLCLISSLSSQIKQWGLIRATTNDQWRIKPLRSLIKAINIICFYDSLHQLLWTALYDWSVTGLILWMSFRGSERRYMSVHPLIWRLNTALECPHLKQWVTYSWDDLQAFSGPIKATLYVVVSVLSYSLLHLLHPLIPPLLYQCGLQVQAAPIPSFIKPND